MAEFFLYPLNDLGFFAKLKDIHPTTGVVTPLTTGTVTCFLSVGKTSTSTAADPSLSVTAAHIADGKWLIFFDATILTYALLNGLFASTPPYLIIQYPSGFRVYVPLTYVAERPAT